MNNNIIAVDVGSSNTGIYQVGQSVVLFEPSLVAFSSDGVKVKEVGFEAKKLVGRTTDSTVVVAPVFESRITDEKACVAMLNSFLNKITVKHFSSRPSVIFSVPCGATLEQIKTYEKVLRGANVSDYVFVESPVLTALGLGLPMTDSSPAFIVDIGGGSTQIAAVSLDGIICGISVNMGGMSIDAMIMSFLRERYGVKIGSLTAETVKQKICSLIDGDMTAMNVSGQSVDTGRPHSVRITAQDLQGTVKLFFDKIFQITGMVLSKLPAEVSADVRKSGIYFSGGVSKTPGLEEYFREKMDMRANVFSDAEVAAVLGGGIIAENKQLLKKLRINKR